jgi:transposase
MKNEKKTERPRRDFTTAFKADVVALCRVGDRSIGEISRDMDLCESAVRRWIRQADVDLGQGKPGELTTGEREELARLRRENRVLQMERDILKKATAFFAKDIL